MVNFPIIFSQLQQEGYIINACLSSGLSDLRSANIGAIGKFYSGFYHLCTAIERLEKTTLIIDHLMSNNMTPPGENAFRGHNIKALYTSVEAVASKHSIIAENSLSKSPFHDEILAFLTRFADGQARYANLDSMKKGSNDTDPLTEWKSLLEEVYMTDVRKDVKDSAVAGVAAVGALSRIGAFYLGHGLDKSSHTLESGFLEATLIEKASRHMIWHLAQIIIPLIATLEELSAIGFYSSNGATPSIPCLGEFFVDFAIAEKKYWLNKKRWP